ncbi:hypothetical protein K439DRAFT_354198 [Ramaria rubella]|nr:hypothetical protein K439DRAFT_354198 [Ramaria rubella]
MGSAWFGGKKFDHIRNKKQRTNLKPLGRLAVLTACTWSVRRDTEAVHSLGLCLPPNSRLRSRFQVNTTGRSNKITSTRLSHCPRLAV